MLCGEVGAFLRVFGDVVEQDGRDGLIVVRRLPAFAADSAGVQLVRPIEQRGVRVLLIEPGDEGNGLAPLGHLPVE